MNGWKTFIFFTIVGILGLVTALEAVDIKSILLPLVCHVDASTVAVPGAEDCTYKIIKIAGVWTSVLSGVGIFLRAVTVSPIFKGLFGE